MICKKAGQWRKHFFAYNHDHLFEYFNVTNRPNFTVCSSRCNLTPSRGRWWIFGPSCSPAVSGSLRRTNLQKPSLSPSVRRSKTVMMYVPATMLQCSFIRTRYNVTMFIYTYPLQRYNVHLYVPATMLQCSFVLNTVKPELAATFIKQPTCPKQPYRMFLNFNFVLIFPSTKQPPALSSHFLCFPWVAA